MQNPSQRQRGERRCSGCRETGHNIRNCPENYIRRERLFDYILVRIISRVPDISLYPRFYERAGDAIYLFVQSLTRTEVVEGFNPGSFAIVHSYTILTDILNSMERTQKVLGKDHAKLIELELKTSNEERSECFICCDKKCSVTTDCGHEFCGGCVINILKENSNKTTSPFCSFCKAPFTKFSVSDSLSYEEVYDFINNVI
jgi:hypothetical protein